MNKIIVKLYNKAVSLKIRLDIEVKRYELNCNPNIKIAESAVIFPEACITSAGKGISIGERTFVRGHIQCIQESGNITIGSECYIGAGTCIWGSIDIRIGNRVLIAHNCNIFDSTTHPLDAIERNNDFIDICLLGRKHTYLSYYSDPVTIEDDVWIGCNCTILKGVAIGSNYWSRERDY